MNCFFIPYLDSNSPLEGYGEFARLLGDKGIDIDVLEKDELNQLEPAAQTASFNAKLQRASVVWINSWRVSDFWDRGWEELRNCVHQGKNLLITTPGLGEDHVEPMEELLEPFGIRFSNFKCFDRIENWESEDDIKFRASTGCLHHESIFRDVELVVLTFPHHLHVGDPAGPLITGNPSTRAVDEGDLAVKAPLVVCAAWSQSAAPSSGSGKVAVFAARVFDDPYQDVAGREHPCIKMNGRLASNTVDWFMS